MTTSERFIFEDIPDERVQAIGVDSLVQRRPQVYRVDTCPRRDGIARAEGLVCLGLAHEESL